ncbi:MAG: hypothetical protein UZ07_CHB004000333 [Chlorobi bacterium OLB7]|nr:MAG: hypothetical protein UZ07_CHB004000333 [Chlorobi bacterium OLB7]
MLATLGNKVLVLNQNYEPLSVCNVQKAVVLLWLGKAELIAARPDRNLRTIRSRYPYPSVVRLNVYVHIPFKKSGANAEEHPAPRPLPLRLLRPPNPSADH